MKENEVLLFVSLWFSLFFFFLALANKLLCFKCLATFDVFLTTLLCVLSSHVCARNLVMILSEKDK